MDVQADISRYVEEGKVTDFERFQKTFREYQKKFGLTGYKCYFQHEVLEDVFANISVNHLNHVATVRLNSSLPKDDKRHKDIQRTAKHEACHLLLSRLADCARARYTSDENIYDALEEVVFKLEDLIP